MITVRDVGEALEGLAPAALAESWDNVGLLAGDASTEAAGVLVALDATPAVLDQAGAHGASLLVTHHPLIFSGLTRVVEDGGTGSVLLRLIREGRSLLAAHTNLDAAPEGLNHYVASRLGLRDLRPLAPSAARPLLKLVVYVPEEHVDAVRSAICAAGAGRIGSYEECTFGVPGVGTFRPQTGSSPFIGQIGEMERVHEIRLETAVPRAGLGQVLAAMLASHPYEEVAYDLLPLENAWPGAGLGRVGALEPPMTLGGFAERAQQALETPRLRVAGDAARTITTAAVCAGGGGDLVEQAALAGADLYLTGEVKHHQALAARQRGMALIEAGHFATERPAVPLLAGYLAAAFPGLPVFQAAEDDPLG